MRGVLKSFPSAVEKMREQVVCDMVGVPGFLDEDS